MSSALTPEEMIREAKPRVVCLRDDEGTGTGFIISHSGHVLTCKHILGGDIMRAISHEGEEWEARVLARDPEADLAILHVPQIKTEPMILGDPVAIAEGQTVYALGHPLGLDFTVSRGVVSSVNRTRLGISYIQTDVPLNPGNSGGPIVNERGEVIGIANWILAQSHGLGFGLALRHVLAFAAQLRVPVKRARAFREADPTSLNNP